MTRRGSTHRKALAQGRGLSLYTRTVQFDRVQERGDGLQSPPPSAPRMGASPYWTSASTCGTLAAMTTSPAKSSNVYEPEAFQARVAYAAVCLVEGIQSRRFDTCFEMFDGDAVVVALVRRARKNPRLLAAIARGWSELVDGVPASWHEKATQHSAIPTRELPTLARTLRERHA